MIVVDASAVVEALAGRDADAEFLALFAGELAAPHLLDVEVLSALRGLSLASALTGPVVDVARQDFQDLTVSRYEIAPLAPRIWGLRHQFTAYDACYLALAEALEAPLLTCDKKLAAGGHRAEVVVFPPGES